MVGGDLSCQQELGKLDKEPEEVNGSIDLGGETPLSVSELSLCDSKVCWPPALLLHAQGGLLGEHGIQDPQELVLLSLWPIQQVVC